QGAVGRIELYFSGLDVTQRLVGGIVVQPIELRQTQEACIGVSDIVVAAQYNLVIDAVQVEEVALHVGIESTERNAAAHAAGAIEPASISAGQVLGVVG